MSDKAHVLLNRLTTKPGRRQRLVEILLESGKLFDDNLACLLYLVSESADDPNLVWVVDLWTSQQAHAEALKAPELRPFVEQAATAREPATRAASAHRHCDDDGPGPKATATYV